MTGIHADIDALKGLHDALARYRHAQRDVTARGEDQLTATRASLETKASPADHAAADRRVIRDGRTGGMRSRTRASPHTVPIPTAAPATVSVK